MIRFLAALVFLLGAAAPLHATCQGTDLTTTLTPSERTQLKTRLAETPYPDGNHWIARRGSQKVHLIGTMHLSDPRLDAPFARLAPVIGTADVLLLEMTETEQKQLESAIASDPTMMLLKDSTLPELMPEDDWNRLADAMRARGLPPFMGARMQPWYISMLLAVPTCLAGQLTEKNGMDARMEAHARGAGVPVKALEPFDTGFRLFDETALDIQLAMIRASLAPEDVNEDLFETLMVSYFAENHALSQIVLEVLSTRLTPLSEEENAQVFRAFDELLLIRRNRAWIPVILDALEKAEAPVVVGFGAAHLAGREGVLQLLENEGFTLERAPF